MNRAIRVTKASLRGDLRGSIEAIEAALRLQAPEPALECLSVEAYLCFATLSFPMDSAARLRELLARLRSMRQSPPERKASALARAMVDLGPDAVTFGSAAAAPWSETMERVLQCEEILFLADSPVTVTLHGADRREARRKIAWLLGQLGVPQ